MFTFSSLRTKLTAPIIIVAAFVVAVSVVFLFNTKNENIQTAGVQRAMVLANTFGTLREFYTKEIVQRALKGGMKANYDYETAENALPLPATMVKALGDHISKEHPGTHIRLYSRYPFPHRAAGAKYDAFELQAISSLEKDPKAPVHRLETVDGKLSMRYAVADVMKAACVGCHNSHPESPKRGWKIGDVRGVLEVIVSVDETAHALTKNTYYVAGVVGGGFILLVFIVLGVMRFSVLRPLDTAVAACNRIAQGDLSVEITENVARDEIGQLLTAMRRFVSKLAQVIGEVRAGASSLSSASQQVSSASQALSQGTSEQAASVEETTSSLEEMSASITQNADNSRQTEQMALKGAKDAEESGNVVRETVQSMRAISSKISIVEEIAYKTNLLALNAAIEAARAGEQGKGLEVVAIEVRKLAERSQVAAKEIALLATSSVNVAERSGTLLQELVPSIRKTADLVQTVAAASREQAANVAQINKAVSQVDSVTQQSATAAEELASTAEEMNSQAEALNQLMEFFKVQMAEGAGAA